MGHVFSLVLGLAISFALVFLIGKFFAGDVSDRSEPGDHPYDT